jgi:hypothetical protein
VGERNTEKVWCLDPANSPELIASLEDHARQPWERVAWVGEGWKELVAECHERLLAQFPTYELLNIKQKYGRLEFQAFPRTWSSSGNSWTTQEYAALKAITDVVGARSETICEWCGAHGVLRDDREYWATLCDLHAGISSPTE